MEGRGRLRRRLAAVLLASLAACSGGDRTESRAPSVSFGEVFRVEDQFTLEETESVVNVVIRVSPDPQGGYLVADERESQIRRYGSDGRLLWHLGRQGAGPGEFRGAVGAVRLSPGEVAAADRTGRLQLFDDSGGRAELLRTVDTGVRGLEGIWSLAADTLLISGFHPDGPMGPRLHVWSMEAGEIVRSFFDPLSRAANPEISVVAGWTRAAVLDDTIVALFATMDTLFFHSREGALERRLPFPEGRFRPVPERGPEAGVSPGEVVEFLSRYDLASDVLPTADGRLLVRYQTPVADDAWTRRWHVMVVTREGDLLFDIRDGPRLFSPAGSPDLFVFQDPSSELPSDWVLGRLVR